MEWFQDAHFCLITQRSNFGMLNGLLHRPDGRISENVNMEARWSREGHSLPWGEGTPSAIWGALGQQKSWPSPALKTPWTKYRISPCVRCPRV